MTPYYPVFLDLKGRPCIIVGGGEVAERKVLSLLECGASVAIISPEVTPPIRDLAQNGRVHWDPREYRQGDLKGAFLAIASTDRQDINEAIAGEAERERIVLNVVDNTPLCSFIAPSIVRKGDVTVAISTGGASPALARKLRETLENSPVLEYAELSGTLSRARGEVRRRGIHVHPDHWQACINDELLGLLRTGGEGKALEHLMSNLQQAPTAPG